MPLIASAGTIATATKNSQQKRVFFDGTRWWCFYEKSGSADTLFYAHSTDLSSWTESSVSIADGPHEGDKVTVLFDQATMVVLVTYWSGAYDANGRYIRGVINGTTITWGATNTLYYSSNDDISPFFVSLCLDSANKPVAFNRRWNYVPRVERATNAISTTFSESNWGAVGGDDPGIADGSYNHSHGAIKPLAAANLLIVFDDFWSSTYRLRFARWNGSSWSYDSGFITSTVVQTISDWDMVSLSLTDIRVLARDGSSSLTFRKYDGSAWSTLTAPAWPNSGIAADSGIALVSDGTDVWAFVIRGDAARTVSCNKYSGSTWAGWTDITSTTAVRTHIQSALAVGGNKAACVWTQQNGGNYEIWVDSVSAGEVPGGTTHDLHGYIAGWSSSTATLKARRNLAGRAAGQSSQVGVFRARKVARATAAGNSSSSAVVRAIRGARATAAGTSAGRGLVRLVRAARGVASGASSAAAVWRIRSALQGAASGVSWALAIVHGAAGAIISLFGRTQGASSSVGTLRVARRTKAITAGAGSADAMLRIARKLAGKTAGSAFGQGVLRRTQAVRGIAQGSSTARGKLTLFRRLIGAAAGAGETAGRMAGRRVLRAVAAGLAGLRGVLTLIKANFRVSAERTIVVPYEDRIIACEAEQRLMTPPAENRIIQV